MELALGKLSPLVETRGGLQNLGLTIECSVGAGGHATHGGYGLSSHTKGLAVDWVVGATVVLANSTAVNASADENPDLFWAIRGAGSSMGVVSEFRFDTYEVPEKVTRFNVIVPWNVNNSVAGLKAMQTWAADEMPAEMNARIFMNAQLPNFEGLYYGSKEDAMAILDPLIEDIGGKLQDATETDWLGQLEHFGHGIDLNQTHPYNKVSSRIAVSVVSAKLIGELHSKRTCTRRAYTPTPSLMSSSRG